MFREMADMVREINLTQVDEAIRLPEVVFCYDTITGRTEIAAYASEGVC